MKNKTSWNYNHCAIKTQLTSRMPVNLINTIQMSKHYYKVYYSRGLTLLPSFAENVTKNDMDEIYKCVYTTDVNHNIPQAYLETIYRRFNSMSIGDVIEVNNQFYIVLGGCFKHLF